MPYVALITGASSGIGEATARRLAREPDTKLVLVARRQERLQALADEIGGATVLAADLVHEDAPGQIRDAIEREHGALHLLINNAGAAWRGRFDDTGWANIERHMKLNFESPVRLTEALLPLLRRSAAQAPDGAGRRVAIVNVASTAARVSRPNSGAYSASKFALAGWSDALHAEERPARGPRRAGASRLYPHRGFSRPGASEGNRVNARGRGRSDHGCRPPGAGGALRPPALLAGCGRAHPRPPAGPPSHGGRCIYHLDRGR